MREEEYPSNQSQYLCWISGEGEKKHAYDYCDESFGQVVYD